MRRDRAQRYRDAIGTESCLLIAAEENGEVLDNSSAAALEIFNVSKWYGQFQVLKDVKSTRGDGSWWRGSS